MASNILTRETLDYVGFQAKRHFNRIGYTGVKMVYLGNGLTPPTVVVPDDAKSGKGEVYIYDAKVDNKVVSRAILDHPGIPFDNTCADMPVWIGYPPMIDEDSGALPHVISSSPPEAFSYTGGALATEVRYQQQQYTTNDRVYSLKVFPGSDTLLLMTSGIYRVGNVIKVVQQQSLVDLAGYVPLTPSMAKYVLLSIDVDGAVTVTEGSEVDVSSISYLDAPTAVPDGELQLAWVRLYEGQTTIADDEITNLQSIPIVTSVTEIIATVGSGYVSSDGSAFVSSDGETFISS